MEVEWKKFANFSPKKERVGKIFLKGFPYKY